MTESMTMQVEKVELLRVLKDEAAFSHMLVSHG